MKGFSFALLLFSHCCFAQSWVLQTQLPIPVLFGLRYSCFSSPDTGVFGVAFDLSTGGGSDVEQYYTSDGGVTWNRAFTNQASSASYGPAWGLKNNNVIYVKDLYGGGGALSCSINGGHTWNWRGSPPYGVNIMAIDSLSYFYWQDGSTFQKELYKFQNATSAFSLVTTLSGVYPLASCFVDSLVGYFAASTDSVWNSYLVSKTTDGGVTWNPVLSDTSNIFLCMAFTSPDNGYVAGQNGVVMRTQDGGVTWSHVNLTTPDHVYQMDFTNDSVGIIGCYGGKIFITTDGGNSWTPQSVTYYSHSTTTLYAFHDTVFYVVQNDSVYKKVIPSALGIEDVGGIPGISIYPNPSATEWIVEVPQTLQDATLVLYDLTGRLLCKEDRVRNKIGVDCRELAKGAYLLKITNDHHTGVYKLVRE
jgi:hypothetical protein